MRNDWISWSIRWSSFRRWITGIERTARVIIVKRAPPKQLGDRNLTGIWRVTIILAFRPCSSIILNMFYSIYLKLEKRLCDKSSRLMKTSSHFTAWKHCNHWKTSTITNHTWGCVQQNKPGQKNPVHLPSCRVIQRRNSGNPI